MQVQRVFNSVKLWNKGCVDMNFMKYSPTRLLFGAGQLNNLREQKLPGKKALVVISNGKSTKMAKNARETMGGLFMCDPCPLSHDDCVKIYEKAYR